MKTFSRSLFPLLLSVLVVFLISCSLPDSPAKGGTATVRMNLSSPLFSSADARAVFGGDGYIYLRTMGGPLGASGPAYGPFPVVGGAAVITGIPAGSYSDILVLHSQKTLEGTSVTLDGVSVPFTEAISLPDSEFTERVMDTEDDEGFPALIDGYGSEGKSGPVTLRSGVNAISLTLVPMCASTSTVELTQSGTVFSGSFGNTAQRFIRLELASNPDDWDTAQVTVSHSTVSPALVLYDRNSSALSDFAFNSSLGAYLSTVPISSFPLYLLVNLLPSGGLNFNVVNGSLDLITPRLQSLTVNGLAVSPALQDAVSVYSATIPNTEATAVIQASAVNSAHAVSYVPSATMSGIDVGDFRTAQVTVTNSATAQSKAYTLTIQREENPTMVVSVDTYPQTSGDYVSFNLSVPGTETKYVDVENTGAGKLVITCAITGNQRECFTVSPAGATIPPGETRTFTVAYTGASPSPDEAELRMSNNDPVASDFYLNLSGMVC